LCSRARTGDVGNLACWSFGVTCAWLIVRILLPRQRQWSMAGEHLRQEVAAAERRRIARDVHDVIAHSMTVTMLHLTGARHVLSTDPQAAVAALAEAERLGRALAAAEPQRSGLGILGMRERATLLGGTLS